MAKQRKAARGGTRREGGTPAGAAASAGKKTRRKAGLRAQEVQFRIANEDWEGLGAAVRGGEVSPSTLRSVVRGYRERAEAGHERAKQILGGLREIGVRAGFRGRGPRAARIAFDEPVARKVQVVTNEKTGARTHLLTGGQQGGSGTPRALRATTGARIAPGGRILGLRGRRNPCEIPDTEKVVTREKRGIPTRPL